MAVDTAAA